MKKIRANLQIHPDKCTGCNKCRQACAMKHFGTENPDLSRISIHRFENQDFYVPAICMACENAPCIKVCPMNARKTIANGSVVTDVEVCIGCKACVYICPVGGPAQHPQTGQTMTCDMCEGDVDGPACVLACRKEGALILCETDTLVTSTARKHAGRLRKMCLK